MPGPRASFAITALGAGAVYVDPAAEFFYVAHRAPK